MYTTDETSVGKGTSKRIPKAYSCYIFQMNSEGKIDMKKPSNLLHDNPFIGCYEKVVTQTECHQLIDLARHGLQPSKVIGNSEQKTSAVRTSDTIGFQHHLTELTLQICKRIASIVELPLNYAEHLQIARYQVGGKFNAHFDTFNPSTELGKMYLSENGQRIITALLYLNNVSAGGETSFPLLNIQVAPSEGTLLVFENCKKNSNERHALSIHEGCAVHEGEKWIATLWFHEKSQY
ncbi:2OG-Fe(II) oxygenase [Bacillus cereus]|uniref:2OG-Fe(II) oxygenase n=2 Tax=Bacillus TaxID=1386 RepID=A0AA44Q6L5_BACCE|nr:2OG-Fe(II) oxygenase [Bacillus cereus Rock3-44]PFA24682.1 2OG-Fe(II) oxygenase [Bacillus cereus]PFO82467.1 2OG-Fe(II) oxygenase [Bacillus cereus]PFR90994.1 2OG-Fe(II) oxygenase [Bacillus cereus]PGZ18684.1 2OG-Fe(II) oxygenase [Bacillus cereus]